MTESSDMKSITQERNIRARLDWYWALLNHIPNGGKRDAITGARLKAEGAQAGFPDWIFPLPNALGQILFIEQKIKGNKLSENQERWFELLTRAGHQCHVAYSPDETISIVQGHVLMGAK